jgi:hypothetical protein
MTRLSRTLLPALALVLGARAAAAQTITSPYDYVEKAQAVRFWGGYLFTGPSLSLSDSTSAELGPRSAPMFGAQYQVRFSGPLSVALAVGYAPSERKVFTAEALRDSTEIRPIDTGRMAKSPVAMAEASLLFHLTGPRTWHGIAPFLLASGGVAAEVGGRDDTEDDVPATKRYDFGPSFAVGAGVGTDWFATQRLSLRLELHGRLWRLSAPEGFIPSTDQSISEWANASGVTVGAAYHF